MAIVFSYRWNRNPSRLLRSFGLSVRCAQEEARKTYDRLERLCSGMTGEVPGRSLSLSGCELILNNVQPLEIDDGTNTAFVLDLTANTSFRMSV